MCDGLVLFSDFSFLLVRLDEHTRITHEVRIPFCQDELNSVRINECNKAKHPFLLKWNPNILNRSKHTSNEKQ